MSLVLMGVLNQEVTYQNYIISIYIWMKETR